MENKAAFYVPKQLKAVQVLHHGQVYLCSAFHTGDVVCSRKIISKTEDYLILAYTNVVVNSS